MEVRTNDNLFVISIHALREEGDRGSSAQKRTATNFYPRPPRGGRQQITTHDGVTATFLSTPSARRATTESGRNDLKNQFLSTPSARRATALSSSSSASWPNFYPRPPRGGRRQRRKCWHYRYYFYPRPPRGGRRNPRRCWQSAVGFLSTPSARRATDSAAEIAGINRISIHALREEGDLQAIQDRIVQIEFLSTPSARRATTMILTRTTTLLFLSTPSARRATGDTVQYSHSRVISIHALREEGD